MHAHTRPIDWHAHTAITRTHRSSKAARKDSAAALGRERSMRPTQARPPSPSQMWLGDAAQLRRDREPMWLRFPCRLVWTARASNWPRNARSVATPVSFESSSHSISLMPPESWRRRGLDPGADVGSARAGVDARALACRVALSRFFGWNGKQNSSFLRQTNSTTQQRGVRQTHPAGRAALADDMRRRRSRHAPIGHGRPQWTRQAAGGRGYSPVGLERLEADRGGALAAAVEHFAVRVRRAVVVLREQVPRLHDRHLQLRVPLGEVRRRCGRVLAKASAWPGRGADVARSWCRCGQLPAQKASREYPVQSVSSGSSPPPPPPPPSRPPVMTSIALRRRPEASAGFCDGRRSGPALPPSDAIGASSLGSSAAVDAAAGARNASSWPILLSLSIDVSLYQFRPGCR
jgi:hypothetical protein